MNFLPATLFSTRRRNALRPGTSRTFRWLVGCLALSLGLGPIHFRVCLAKVCPSPVSIELAEIDECATECECCGATAEESASPSEDTSAGTEWGFHPAPPPCCHLFHLPSLCALAASAKDMQAKATSSIALVSLEPMRMSAGSFTNLRSRRSAGCTSPPGVVRAPCTIQILRV